MEKKTLGKMIQENREKQGISRKNLCEGLCTAMALARYELGERVPDKFLADALLERLGLNPFRYEFVVSDQEFEYSMKREKIAKLLCREQTKEAEEALREYQSGLKKKDVLHWQYVLLEKAVLLGKGKNYPAAVPLLREALEHTDCRRVESQKAEDILLTNVETELFYLLAKFQYLAGEREEAYAYFLMLKAYMENERWDAGKWREYHPHILYRLAQHELERGNPGKSYEYLSQAEKILIENYQLDNLYEILELKKTAALTMGINEKGNEGFLLALKLILTSEKGKLSKEGLDLWESTVSQKL